MDKQLAMKLIAPATFVTVVVIFAIDNHLTRRAKLEAMRIVADASPESEPTIPDIL